MFRFLVVEDVLDTLVQLCNLLTETFPGCHIDRAQTVLEGVTHLERGRTEGITYDAAVLDFHLPSGVGSALSVDTVLRDAVGRVMPGGIIVNITAYQDDPAVVDQMMKSFDSTDRPRHVLVPKGDSKWGSTLVRELQQYLHSRQIVAGLDELFGPEDSAFAEEPRLRKEGRLTHELRSFTVELEDLWSSPLEERVRERVLKHFDQWPGPSGPRFTLKFPLSRDPQ